MAFPPPGGEGKGGGISTTIIHPHLTSPIKGEESVNKPAAPIAVPPAINVKQLEARRAVVRKKLEDGVNAMYQEALSLYKHGNYTAAADKFKDVQDILPGYKRSGQYMDEARRKSLTFQSVITLNASAVPSSSPVAREDSISKTLDLFDSNVQ